MDIQYTKIREIFLDSSCTHLEPRWWHKFMFWRKFKYPSCIQRRVFVSMDDIKNGGAETHQSQDYGNTAHDRLTDRK